jgi:hypothetical protein
MKTAAYQTDGATPLKTQTIQRRVFLSLTQAVTTGFMKIK